MPPITDIMKHKLKSYDLIALFTLSSPFSFTLLNNLVKKITENISHCLCRLTADTVY